MKVHPEYGQPSGPPTDNPRWHKGEHGQWRLPKPSANWQREGQHACLAALVGACPAIAYIFGNLELLILTLVGQVMVGILFLAYEITEGWRLRDFAYRDVGGYLAGSVAALVIGLGVILTKGRWW